MRVRVGDPRVWRECAVCIDWGYMGGAGFAGVEGAAARQGRDQHGLNGGTVKGRALEVGVRLCCVCARVGIGSWGPLVLCVCVRVRAHVWAFR